MASRERDLEADLECGGTPSEEEGCKDSALGRGQQKKTLNRGRSGILSFSGSIKGKRDGLATFWDIGSENIELLSGNNSSSESGGIMALMEKTNSKEKRKKPSSKRPPKPPRPPIGPSLSASDLKFVREISELTAKKCARIERMRALRKMKTSRGSSSMSSITAMVITIIFFIVIILQGYMSFHMMLIPVATEGLTSLKFYNSPSNEMNGIYHGTVFKSKKKIAENDNRCNKGGFWIDSPGADDEGSLTQFWLQPCFLRSRGSL
ncbi:hypothetical protein Ancab_022519 [Ancistrocladus abbreviatus]